MGNDKFIKMAKAIVADYVNENSDKKISTDNIFVVWYAKILQNNKILLITDLKDNMYYELSYNGDKNEVYVDVYKKWQNFVVKIV